jgi:hypothetical protein
VHENDAAASDGNFVILTHRARRGAMPMKDIYSISS